MSKKLLIGVISGSVIVGATLFSYCNRKYISSLFKKKDENVKKECVEECVEEVVEEVVDVLDEKINEVEKKCDQETVPCEKIVEDVADTVVSEKKSKLYTDLFKKTDDDDVKTVVENDN